MMSYGILEIKQWGTIMNVTLQNTLTQIFSYKQQQYFRQADIFADINTELFESIYCIPISIFYSTDIWTKPIFMLILEAKRHVPASR